MKAKTNQLINSYKYLWKIMSTKERFCFLAFTFLSLLKCVATVLVTQVLACIVSKLEGKTARVFGVNLPQSWTIIQVVIFSFALIAVCWILFCIITANMKKFSAAMACKVNQKVLDELLKPRKNLDYHMTSGEAVFIARSAGESVLFLIKDLLLKIIIPLVSCVIALVFIAFIDLVCFAIFLSCFLLMIATSFIRLKFESKMHTKLETSKSKINNLYLNNIENISLVTMIDSQRHEQTMLEEENKKYKKQWYNICNLAIGYWSAIYAIQYSLVAVGVIVCILRTGTDAINISNIVALVSYASQLCSPLEYLGIELGQLQQRAIQLNRLKLLEPKAEDLLQDSDKSLPKNIKFKEIRIKDLHVTVGDFDKKYPDISFVGNAINVITGGSGSGKSLLIGALLGLKTHEKASIEINNKYKVDSLYSSRQLVSYISQKPLLFDRSVVENACYPNKSLSKDVKSYMKSLDLERLESRNQSESNASLSLSGGEQKRISLIRGISKKASLYIFDEPTNDLDNKNIERVIKQILKLKNKKMVVIISHDKRILEIADNIISL